jgi:CubicO group peptidase (beta-lactamase class C family)
VQLLRPETVELGRTVQSEGTDAVLDLPTRFGLGFMLPPALSLAAAPTAFGHPGAGGSLGFADPEAELGFGYVMNQMQLAATGDPRSMALVEAVYAALA